MTVRSGDLPKVRSVVAGKALNGSRSLPETVLLRGYQAAVMVVVLLLWSVFSRFTSDLLLPPPLEVLKSMANVEMFVKHGWVTLQEIIGGFVLGSILGIGVGSILAHFDLLRKVLSPYVVASQAIPKAALAPMFVLWLGFGMAPKVAIAALISFFPLLENTLVGLREVERNRVDLFRSLGASKWQAFIWLRFPNALPYIMTGLRVAIVFSIVGAIVGEFVSANRGLGALIVSAQGTMNAKLMFASIIVLTLLGVILYMLLSVLQNRFFAKYSEQHTQR